MFSIDSFINFLNIENKTIQYIKIDIEGSELEAIFGAKNVLRVIIQLYRLNIIQALIVIMNSKTL